MLCTENSATLKRTTHAVVRVSSLVLSFSLSFSLSLESKVNAKVVSKLSRERVLWRKVFRVFDGVPQRERESVFAQRARKSTTTRDSTTCCVRRKECICELNFCFRSKEEVVLS